MPQCIRSAAIEQRSTCACQPTCNSTHYKTSPTRSLNTQRKTVTQSFAATRTARKSGLRIHGRIALANLIKDVISGGADFKTILVYDVSRWGRFQDTDESAHYEFI